VEGEYSTLVLTPAGDEVLYQGRKVLMRREAERAAKVKTAKAAKSAPVDLPAEAAPVFEKLRAWRTAQAKEQAVPPYIIFNDATLRQIAATTPSTLDELSAISGVGENKLAKYGQQILDTLSA
jgi:ATP-dependent DNA helicase RecQ